jgi:hypothetical protein
MSEQQSSADSAVEGKRDAIVQLIHKHIGVRQRVNVDLTGVEDAADAILRNLNVPQTLPVKLTGEIACILEDCSPPDKQTPEAVAALIEGYQPTWDRIRSALTRSQAVSAPLASNASDPLETLEGNCWDLRGSRGCGHD